MNQEKIGKFIAKSRKKKNMTQEQLAQKLGITAKAVSKWECGKGLPDVSLYEPLCKELNITLNEFFAGESLKKEEVVSQSEKNIQNILKVLSFKNHKYKKLLFFVVIFGILFLFFLGRILLIRYGFLMDEDLKYTQLYIQGEGNIQGEVDVNSFGKLHIDFDVGANQYGIAVFKNPKKAFKRLKKEYAKGISLIQKEFHLLPFTNFTYQQYKTYGWQVTTGSKEEQKQAHFVTSFLDIYENSFRT